MKTAPTCRIVLVTAPNRKTARLLAKAALARRLVACANLVPGIESHYHWLGRVESGKEVLLLFKADAKTLKQLEQLILELHPYDTPEIVALKVDGMTPRYLRWWKESLR